MEGAMGTKLTINLKDGILNVEGSEDLVRSVYEDFKAEVAKRLTIPPAAPKQIEAASFPAPEVINVPTEKPRSPYTV
jgi:hypothetical protein